MKHHAIPIAVALIACLVAVTAPVHAGVIEGFCYTPFKSAQSGISICANREGNLPPAGFGQATTWEAAPVGWYQISGLYVGNYGLLFNEKDQWPRALMYGISVPSSSTVYVNRRIDYPNHVTGLTWDPYTKAEWCQSFVATGTSVVQVGLHEAIEFGPDTLVSIHQGGPDGPQIGPAKLIPTVVVNPSSAYWSHGEVPVVPGQTYTVRFYVPSGQQRVFLGGGRIQGGKAFPDGRTWADGIPWNDPIKMTVFQDDDGIVSCVNTKKAASASLPLAYRSVTTLGQTFTAHGSSLLSLSLLVGATSGTKLTATVWQSPGTNGQGATQVGCGKNIKPVDWNARSGCCWMPGEVPLVDGQSYYVKITRADNQPFTVYYVNENEYTGGMLYLDGIGQADADLSTTITCEEYTGSLNKPTVQISGISVARGANSATVSWTTDVATTTDYVEYSPANPYASSASATSGTSHSVTLTGLTPNTLYHYRVASKVSGYRDAVSRDFVFVTDPDQPNLLQNPGFESGDWGTWTSYIAPESNANDFHVRNSPSFGLGPHSGSCYVGGWTNGLHLYAGVYQTVPVTPGLQLKARAWVWNWQTDNLGGFLNQTTCYSRVGIDATGGTDPTALTVSWSDPTVGQDLFGTGDGSWCEAWARATAGSSQATVFIEGGAHSVMAWTVFGFDDAVLTQVPPVDVGKIVDLAPLANGTFVRLTGTVVIATASQAGAVYVEDPDRVSGLRVETASTCAVGDRVTVVGVKDTLPSGDLYIHDAALIDVVAGDPPGALGTVAKSIGKAGPGNTGMLMRVAGRMNMDDNLVFYIDDGSVPGLGLKLVKDSLTWDLYYGEMYTVTGVVQMEGTTPVLRPRGDSDAVLINQF